MDRPAVAELMADVSGALARRVNALCEVIPREIQQLNGDAAVFADTAEDTGHDQQPKESR